MWKFLALTTLLLTAGATGAGAQTATTDSVGEGSVEKKENFGKRLDNKLSTRYFKSKYDTNYVVRPAERWLLKPSFNVSGANIHAKGTVKGVWSKYDLYTKLNTSVSMEVDYCDIALSLALNLSKLSGSYNDYEFNFEYHGNMLSLDLNYQRSTSMRGDVNLKNFDYLDEDALNMKVFTLTAYYTFSHRKFSFPAAFYQNYIQRRSAGSWLAGLTFQSGCIRTTDELKERSPQAPVVHLDAAHLGIGGGYGYNFVLGSRSQWLLHISALPTIVVYNHNSLAVNDEEVSGSHIRFNMLFNERAAVVYHFSERCFVGSTLMMSQTVFDNKDVTVNQNKGILHAFVGIRL